MENQDNKKTVKDMCQKYSAATNETIKDKIAEECNVKTYLPILSKIKLIHYIIEDRITLTNEEGLVSYDPIDNEIYFLLSTIMGYTDLQIEDEIEDFDELISSGLMGTILEKIGSDTQMYKDMYELYLDYYLRENNNLQRYIELIVSSILAPLSNWSENFSSFVEANGGIDHILDMISDLNKQYNN